jgi:hypothetical protein
MSQHEKTNRGLVKDIQANVLRLVQDAFRDEEYLGYLEYPKDIDEGSLLKACLTDLPAVRVWVTSFGEDVNKTGAALGRRQREMLEFKVVVAYCTHYATISGGEDIIAEVGWGLREKLAQNTTLFGLAHLGADISDADFEPELVNLNDKLFTADCVKLVIDYKLIRMRKRAQ